MRLPTLLPALVLASLAAQAQVQTGIATGTSTLGEATPYQVQRDSLWQRAERIRRETAARTQAIHTGFTGLLGTQRNILSLGGSQSRPVQDDERIVPIKREVEKHKTHNAQVRKVTYYTTGGKPRLYEYYEDGLLVQLELYDYPLGTGPSPNAFVTMRWVRGNYLSVSQRASTGTGGSLTQSQAYAEPEPLPR